MIMLTIWSVPTLIHLAVARGSRAAVVRNGLLPSTWRWTLWGMALGLIGVLVGMLATMLLPTDAPGLATGGVLGVAAAAAGEEIFFRGFLQGWLASVWGARAGLWGQAVIFLLPHLLLLLADAALWPLLPVQFLMGLACGVLRQRSGSVLPGTVAHVLTNVATSLMR